MDRTIHLIERQLIARAVVLMPVDGVDGLMQAAAERDVQLLKTAAYGSVSASRKGSSRSGISGASSP